MTSESAELNQIFVQIFLPKENWNKKLTLIKTLTKIDKNA